MKIISISDTHIRNFQYHDLYRTIFEELYKKIREEEPDLIVHCGDVAHSKTDITPEFVQLTSEFLNTLSNIATTIVILGNHDLNLNNRSRMNAIEPIVQNMSGDITLLKEETWKRDTRFGVAFYCFSMESPEPVEVFDHDYINIGLYHGAILDSETDTKWKVGEGPTLSLFKGFDFVMLGDIHKTNQQIDLEGRVRYAGSTIQQGFGEDDDKGFLVWDIKDKNNFVVKHVKLENPEPFINYELSDEFNTISKNSRVRIHDRIGLSKIQLSEITSQIKKQGAKHVAVKKYLSNKKDKSEKQPQQSMVELFGEMIDDSSLLEKVLKLDEHYHFDEDFMRNVKWKIKNFEWSNLIDYGENNSINFSNLSGIVGIIGSNYTGKSSVIDGILFTLYNSLSKNSRKSVDIINEDKEQADGKLTIDIDGNEYVIERSLKRNSDGESAKTSLKYTKNGESIALPSRTDTDKDIRKLFGTLDDFLFTSTASQFGLLNFIDEGSTKRKEILAKFLDLDQYAEKYKKAKAESGDLRSFLKKINEENYLEKISECEKAIKVYDSDIFTTKCSKETENKQLLELEEHYEEIRQFRDAQVINRDILLENISKEKKTNESFEQEIRELMEIVPDDASDTILSLKNKVHALTKSLNEIKSTKLQQKKFQGRPCGDTFVNCPFLENMISSDALNQIEKFEKITQEDFNATDAMLHSLILEQERRRELLTQVDGLQATINFNIKRIKALEEQLKQDSFDEKIVQKAQTLHAQILDKKRCISVADANLQKLTKEIAILNERIRNLKEQEQKRVESAEQYEVYDAYLKCVHPNGIPFRIIQRHLDIINEEIQTVLEETADFGAQFVVEGDRLEIMIQHPNQKPRAVEMASGAEKTMVSIAVRLALLKITTLPIPNFFVMDEPSIAFDMKNMERFVSLLDMIKEQFEIVILISHLNALKDAADVHIEIDKIGKYSHICI